VTIKRPKRPKPLWHPLLYPERYTWDSKIIPADIAALNPPVPGELFFVMPLPPNVTNERGHWRTRRKQQQEYWERLDLLVTLKRLPRPPKVPMTAAALESVFFLCTKAMDFDNLAARLKHACDWLKLAGYIVDDSPAHLRQLRWPMQSRAKITDPRLELRLIPVET